MNRTCTGGGAESMPSMPDVRSPDAVPTREWKTEEQDEDIRK